MTRFIVFANRKGGCGKTTTAVNVAHALAMKDKKILFVDVDPQAHSTMAFETLSGVSSKPTLLDFLTGKVSFKQVVVETAVKGISLIPASSNLGLFEMEHASQKGSETILRDRLKRHVQDFDYVIFDPSPSIGLLTISALVASKEVYVPLQMHFYAIEGLVEIMQLIFKINAGYNSDLALRGIIPTFYNKRTKMSKEIDIIKNFSKDKLMPPIRTNITLAEAPGHGKTVFEYAPKSHGAYDYLQLAEKIESNDW